MNISPLGFHTYAAHFFRAARLARSDARTEFSPVPYYLYGHALELLMKAFLLSKRISWLKLRALGHDLARILKRANREGLTAVFAMSTSQTFELVKANAYYKKKGFEYFDVGSRVRGYPNLPDLDVLDALCSALVDRLEPVCLDA